MTFISLINKKKDSIFQRIDKNEFSKFFPFWQYAIYSAIAVYFVLTLTFQENPYPYTSGIIKPFFVLINEIVSPTGTHINPILNRGLDNGGHVLAYLSILICAIVPRMYMPKTTEGMYYSLLIPAFALSISEGTFNVFYYVINYHLWPYVTWDIFILTNPLAIMYIIILLVGIFITPIWNILNHKKILISVFLIYAYFFLWTILGFPVTLSSINYFQIGSLETQWYNDLQVNLLEIGQWIIASFSFAWCCISHTSYTSPSLRSGNKI